MFPDPVRLAYHWSREPQRKPRTKYLKLYPETYLESDTPPCLGSVTSYTILTWPSINWLSQQLGESVNPDRFRY